MIEISNIKDLSSKKSLRTISPKTLELIVRSTIASKLKSCGISAKYKIVNRSGEND